ncbi:MAG: hydrogenase small subunit [Chloroflexi bacterium]|nr:hydrogenase small subunit [Chloroflexota bacterium]
MEAQSLVAKSLLERGITRRDFLKFCALMAGTLALPMSYGTRIAEALEKKTTKLPVIWLEFQDCAGCSESFTRSSKPSAAHVVLDLISLEYHETLMAAAGFQAEQAREEVVKRGGYLVIIEGGVPKGDDGVYCVIAGRTALQVIEETVKNAAAVITVGNCGSFGGIPRAHPSPTTATGARFVVKEMFPDKPIIGLPGCPVNAVNVTATLVHFLAFGELPPTDQHDRPLFAYGALIHDNCPRRAHFDRGEFVREWGDEGHRKGWCLYKMGCKGPITYANCPAVQWNDGLSWPIGSGHGCIGCTELDFWDRPIYEPVKIQEAAPPAFYPSVEEGPEGKVDAVSAGITGAVVGAAAVAGATLLKGKKSNNGSSQPSDEG